MSDPGTTLVFFAVAALLIVSAVGQLIAARRRMVHARRMRDPVFRAEYEYRKALASINASWMADEMTLLELEDENARILRAHDMGTALAYSDAQALVDQLNEREGIHLVTREEQGQLVTRREGEPERTAHIRSVKAAVKRPPSECPCPACAEPVVGGERIYVMGCPECARRERAVDGSASQDYSSALDWARVETQP